MERRYNHQLILKLHIAASAGNQQPGFPLKLKRRVLVWQPILKPATGKCDKNTTF
jgi:hypothetical protein